jgi:hypothetical protein
MDPIERAYLEGQRDALRIAVAELERGLWWHLRDWLARGLSLARDADRTKNLRIPPMLLRLASRLEPGTATKPFGSEEGWWIVDGWPRPDGDRIAFQFYAYDDQTTRTDARFFADDLIEVIQSP